MLNSIVDLGDEDGSGHFVSMTPFEEGSVVLSSYNPDDGTRQNVVLMEKQWKRVIETVISIYGRKCCSYSDGPGCCAAGDLDVTSAS